MTIYLNPSPKQKEEMARSIALHQMKENWERLLEVISEDSTLEEILAFALRLDEIPRYTREEEFARKFIREGSTHIRRFENVGGPYGCYGFYWEEHTEEPVTPLELPSGLIQKGSKSWTIKI
jgi:hypothetical protein